MAVESLVSVRKRWMLSHEAEVNSAAKPTGHRIFVCVKEFAFLGGRNIRTVEDACPYGPLRRLRRHILSSNTVPVLPKGEVKKQAVRICKADGGAGVGRDPRRWREVCCLDVSIRDVSMPLPYKVL